MKNCAKKSLAGIFILFIAFFAVLHLSLLWEVCKQIDGTQSVAQLTKQLHDTLLEKIEYKFEFLDLNGLFARALGEQEHNNVIKLKNKMLTSVSKVTLSDPIYTNEICQLVSSLKPLDIEYLYVQAPCKMDLKNELYPRGKSSVLYELNDKFISELRENNIRVLDLREAIAATPQLVQENFYHTDHHWNTRGAFTAFQMLAETMKTIYPIENAEDRERYALYTRREMWEEKEYKGFWLGSLGKRVGRFYGGVEDFSLYVPKFETNLSLNVTDCGIFGKGDLEEACVRKDALKKVNPHLAWSYCAFLGTDWALATIRNPNALIKKKLFIIKDSYALPVVMYFSTLVEAIDIYDPRINKEFSVAEYIRNRKPDMVMHILNAEHVTSKHFYDSGINNCQRFTNEVVEVKKEKVRLTAGESDYAHDILVDRLWPKNIYKVDVSKVDINEGAPQGITFALYNPTRNETKMSYTFDLEYYKTKEPMSWTFKVPDCGEWQLLVYAGFKGKTKGVTVTLHQPVVTRLEVANE